MIRFNKPSNEIWLNLRKWIKDMRHIYTCLDSVFQINQFLNYNPSPTKKHQKNKNKQTNKIFINWKIHDHTV